MDGSKQAHDFFGGGRFLGPETITAIPSRWLQNQGVVAKIPKPEISQILLRLYTGENGNKTKFHGPDERGEFIRTTLHVPSDFRPAVGSVDSATANGAAWLLFCVIFPSTEKEPCITVSGGFVAKGGVVARNCSDGGSIWGRQAFGPKLRGGMKHW